MAESHPYISGPGNITKMISQLRKSFPQAVTSETVKKLGLASKNESYVINALQFVGIINAEGKKTPEAAKVFSHHKDDEFSKEFSKLVEKAYSALFDLHGEGSWDLDTDELITFFRTADQTSDAIGRRQANTFKIFSGLSGHGELPDTKTQKPKNSSALPKKKAAKATSKTGGAHIPPPVDTPRTKDIGLTVRVEINLPADGTKETYDNIFKSIKENLING